MPTRVIHVVATLGDKPNRPDRLVALCGAQVVGVYVRALPSHGKAASNLCPGCRVMLESAHAPTTARARA